MCFRQYANTFGNTWGYCQFHCDVISTLAAQGLSVISFADTTNSKFVVAFIIRHVPDKIKVGNKFDSVTTLICAIIKVQSNKEASLTDNEASKLKPWKLGGAENVRDEDNQSDLDEPILLVLEQMNRDRKRQVDMAE